MSEAPQNPEAAKAEEQQPAKNPTEQMWAEYEKQRDQLRTHNKKKRDEVLAAEKARLEKKQDAKAPNPGLADTKTADNAPSAGTDAAPGSATAAAGPVGTK